MDPKQIFGMRVRQARQAAGLSLRKLQEKMQSVVSHAQLAKYENGLDVPSSGALLALCSSLSCSPDQLFRPVRVGVDSIQFRKKSQWSKVREKAVKALVQDGVDRYFELEELVGVEAKSLKPLHLRCGNPEQAEEAAEEVRKSWKLGNNPIANVVELLEESHVKVQEVEADKCFDGCSGWGSAGDVRFPVIVLANWMNEDLARKRFTAAHELGHLVMDLAGLDPKETEKACHRFAGAFLLPRAALYSQLGRHRTQIEWKELAVLKQEYGISMGASLHRLHDLGMISDAVNKKMSIVRNCKGWKTSEPYAYAGSEECFRFRQLLYRGLAEEKLSLSKAAELARKPVEEIQDELSTGSEGSA